MHIVPFVVSYSLWDMKNLSMNGNLCEMKDITHFVYYIHDTYRNDLTTNSNRFMSGKCEIVSI